MLFRGPRRFPRILMPHVTIISRRAGQNSLGRQVAHSVERRILEAEVWGSKPVLGTWW